MTSSPRIRARRVLIGAGGALAVILVGVFVAVLLNIASTLNRRSPVLAYLSCSDARDQAVDTTEKEFLLGLVDDASELPFLRRNYERAVEVRAKTHLPEADGGCGGLPTGG